MPAEEWKLFIDTANANRQVAGEADFLTGSSTRLIAGGGLPDPPQNRLQ